MEDKILIGISEYLNISTMADYFTILGIVGVVINIFTSNEKSKWPTPEMTIYCITGVYLYFSTVFIAATRLLNNKSLLLSIVFGLVYAFLYDWTLRYLHKEYNKLALIRLMNITCMLISLTVYAWAYLGGVDSGESVLGATITAYTFTYFISILLNIIARQSLKK